MSYRIKNRPNPANEIGLPLVFCLLAIFVGVALAMILGPDFIFFHVEHYGDIGWPAFLLLLPVITIGLLASAKGKLWRSRFSLARLPHVFGWTLAIALFSLCIVVSPLGYLAMANEVVGYDVTVKASVIGVHDEIQREGRGKKRCTRFASLLVGKKTIGICLADHYKPNDNIQGEDVLLQVRQSPFGVSIGQMTLAR